jgi:hypothetical protein
MIGSGGSISINSITSSLSLAGSIRPFESKDSYVY